MTPSEDRATLLNRLDIFVQWLIDQQATPDESAMFAYLNLRLELREALQDDECCSNHP